MHAAILTYPGHFFMSALTVRSVRKFFPNIDTITVLYDDICAEAWPGYAQDVEQWMCSQSPALDFKPYSTLPGIDKTSVGWWRQQLIKIYSDQLLPGDEWLVIDGDVVFEQTFDYKITPVARRPEVCDTNVAVMTANYVQRVLGINERYMTYDNTYAVTSSIPFRWMDRQLLQGLRNHVEQKWNKNFVQLHMDWFNDQTIVAFWDPPERMIMSEWEIIEAYRHYVAHNDVSIKDVGSGYHTLTHTPGCWGWLFRHSCMKDQDLGRKWFEHQFITVPDTLWDKSTEWHTKNRV